MITVIGLGFVGLTTALGFCEKGYRVYGYDIDEQKIAHFKQGQVPFFEPTLAEKLQAQTNKQFFLVDHLKEAITNSEIIFLCVGTPCQADGSVNLTYIYQAIEDVVKNIDKSTYKVLVIKSTVPPGSTSGPLKEYIEKLGLIVGKDIGLTNNPEFLREGYAWEDFIHPDRIIVGEEDVRSGQIVEKVYRSFQAPIYRVSLNTAEYIKYLSNTLLATLISFSNEQSLIAKSIGDISIREAFHALHLDKRWFGFPATMNSYVFPGCGFGGYCLPKDTLALVAQANKHNYRPEILQSVLHVNDAIQEYVVLDICKNTNVAAKIGILGLAFKPNSNDVRSTPAKKIISRLIERGHRSIVAYDPMAMEEFRNENQLPIHYAADLSSFLSQVDHVVILTAWDEFKNQEAVIKEKNVFDYRYLYS